MASPLHPPRPRLIVTSSLRWADAGIASSKDGPLLGTNPPSPLNAMVGLNLNQSFVLGGRPCGVAAELKRLYDVVLYAEYTATY